MQTQVRKDGEAFVCAVIGDVDMYSAPTLHGTWRDHAANRAPAPFIVDMARTEYLDSSGVGVFVQILADSRAKEIPFFICNIRGMAEKLMRLSHMSCILPIEPTLDAALGKARQRAVAH
ncbi:MAG TPA: STAS domain-containing protein [Treponemataceae bacterium]|nr:STAS domain-containing protein [Treponemataceae bacterium]HPS43592.1 STAS domain-containing protein [Treponemataceae bacterium]